MLAVKRTPAVAIVVRFRTLIPWFRLSCECGFWMCSLRFPRAAGVCGTLARAPYLAAPPWCHAGYLMCLDFESQWRAVVGLICDALQCVCLRVVPCGVGDRFYCICHFGLWNFTCRLFSRWCGAVSWQLSLELVSLSDSFTVFLRGFTLKFADALRTGHSFFKRLS